jgi:2,3-bisphosphoglycerate-dependent phosphoglycerate mutase
MNYLILIRHGQSQWNLENRFTGWVDVDLSPQGEIEAKQAGELLKALNVPVDRIFTSVLKRAIRTMEIACQVAAIQAPVEKDQALNERHYGNLQGLNKAETAAKFGEEQVHIWRRSYDIAPPGGESLKDTAERVWPYYDAHIEPLLNAGKNILIVAHGNSLRALIMKLDQLKPEEIVKVEIPTGVPLVYEFESGKPCRKYYLGSVHT